MNYKVLVADDDPYILMSLEFLMKKNKYQVHIARDGAEAYSIVQEVKPDLAILDIMMPEMNGFELCQQIKKDPSTRHCEVVFVSAKSKQQDFDKGYQLGAALYISKPFSTKVLVQQVEEILSRKSKASEQKLYQQQYLHSITNTNDFWLKEAQQIHWLKQPAIGVQQNKNDLYNWFKGGKLNLSYLCLDYHIENGRGDQYAMIYDSPVTNTIQHFTYKELREQVALLAGALQNYGVAKGDRVIVYMPMIPQAVMAMLACARIGAIHSVVFGGFAPHELAIRIDDCNPKLILTANYGVEYEKKIHYKPLIDEAINQASYKPETVFVYLRNGEQENMIEGRDVVWQDAINDAVPISYTPMDATDPLYILYTSGTTGKPKGILRDNTYAVALKYSMTNIYNAQAGDVFWAASDVGWVVGHSYIVYGPLIQGCTTVLFEGKPIKTPDASTFWRIIEQHNVKVMFTAPTAIRAIKKEDDEGVGIKKHNLKSLKYLFLAGERCDPATYLWIKEHLNIPVIDHWWQTESGWPMLGLMMGIEEKDAKVGSANLPICGYEIDVLNEDGNKADVGEEGNIVVKMPLPPGCLPTLWNDEEGYKKGYLSKYEGYYLTGDGGYKDADGYFFVMGRIDDVINVAGHRLSTGEIEEVLAAHKAIAECAVVGIGCELKGQKPVGFVVLKDGVNITEEKLIAETIALVREQIGPVASYKDTVLVPRLPKTRSGKILRKIMRFIADGKQFTIPSTIDDPNILKEIETVLAEKKLGFAFEK